MNERCIRGGLILIKRRLKRVVLLVELLSSNYLSCFALLLCWLLSCSVCFDIGWVGEICWWMACLWLLSVGCYYSSVERSTCFMNVGDNKNFKDDVCNVDRGRKGEVGSDVIGNVGKNPNVFTYEVGCSGREDEVCSNDIAFCDNHCGCLDTTTRCILVKDVIKLNV